MEESPPSKKPEIGTVDSIIMSSMYVLMLSVSKLFIKVNNERPKVVADKDDHFDGWCKKMSIVPYEINFKGECVRKGDLMSSYNTTSSSYITITERVIYYHFNGKVDTYKQSRDDRLSSLFALLDETFLVAHKNQEIFKSIYRIYKRMRLIRYTLFLVSVLSKWKMANRRKTYVIHLL